MPSFRAFFGKRSFTTAILFLNIVASYLRGIWVNFANTVSGMIGKEMRFKTDGSSLQTTQRSSLPLRKHRLSCCALKFLSSYGSHMLFRPWKRKRRSQTWTVQAHNTGCGQGAHACLSQRTRGSHVSHMLSQRWIIPCELDVCERLSFDIRKFSSWTLAVRTIRLVYSASLTQGPIHFQGSSYLEECGLQ